MRYAFCNLLWGSALRRGYFRTHLQRRPGRLPGQAGGRHHRRGLALLPPPDARPLTEGGLPPFVGRLSQRRSGIGLRSPALSLGTGARRALPGAVALAAVVRPADHHHLLADAAGEAARRLRRYTRPRDARRKRARRLGYGLTEGVRPPDWAATDLRGSRRRIEGPVFPGGAKRLNLISSRRHPSMPNGFPLSTAFPTSCPRRRQRKETTEEGDTPRIARDGRRPGSRRSSPREEIEEEERARPQRAPEPRFLPRENHGQAGPLSARNGAKETAFSIRSRQALPGPPPRPHAESWLALRRVGSEHLPDHLLAEPV
jgi:hypothetical protein